MLCLAGGPWPLPDKLGHEAVRRILARSQGWRAQTDRRELAGADLIARILGGRADATDTECSPDATHDFNIIGLANNRVVALEITSAVDPSVVSQLKAAFDQEWSFPRLANNWMIAIQQTRGEPPASIRKVMAGMSPILELFERREETSVEVRSSPRHRPRAPGTTDELHEAMIRMFDLRVEVARLWSKPEPGHPGAIHPTISAGIGSNPQHQLVADCAERKVNKLVAAPAHERHLIVWLDSSHEDAELAFATLPPPPPPTIPSGIDIVWLVGPTGGPGGVRIWRLKPPGGWDLCPPPTGYALRFG